MSSLFVLLLLTPLQDQEKNQGGYRLRQIRLFEGPDADIPRNQRMYAETFSKSSARFIWCEVEVDNLLHNDRAHTHTIVYEYYNPDGSLRGKADGTYTIKPEWVISWYQRGWGYAEPGHWGPGKYKIVVTMDGRKLGERTFTIVESKAEAGGYRVQKIRCFESGSKPPDKPQRQYRSQFNANDTRFVWCEVEVENLQCGQGDHSHPIQWKFYDPKGAVLATVDANFSIKSIWDRAWHQSGYGWNDAGHWTPGTYRVEVLIDGKKVGERTFTVVSSEPQD
jgi:hypothetical protein